MEVDPEPRSPNFTLSSPENEKVFGLTERDIPFNFSFTRNSTDFAEYTFIIKLCRDAAFTNCVDVVPNEADTFSLPFPFGKFNPDIFLFSLISLALLFLIISCFYAKEKLRTLSVLSSLVFVFLYGCTQTENKARDASPDLRRSVTMNLPETGAYHWRVIASAEGQEPQMSEDMVFYRGAASNVQLQAGALNPNDTVGQPVMVDGASEYQISGCPGFQIDRFSGQVSVSTAPPTTGASQSCTVRASDGANFVDFTVTVNYTIITFSPPYSFVTVERASMGQNVGTPVTAAATAGGAIAYSLASCTGFQIDSGTGQITLSANNPPLVTINCVVTASSDGNTQMVSVMIDVRVICTATTLPNNADTNGDGDRLDAGETDMTIDLGPTNSASQSCGGWELVINAVNTGNRQVRVYQFLNLIANSNYRLTLQRNNTDFALQVIFREAPMTSSGQGSALVLAFANLTNTRDITTSSTGTQYHLNFEEIAGSGATTLTLTLLPN